MIFLLTSVISFLLILYFFSTTGNHPKAPPGPRPWPILGNLVHMALASKNLLKVFSELSKTYGEIISLRVGFKQTVALTSHEAIQKIFTNDAAIGRDDTGMFGDRMLGMNVGIATCEGKMWERNRTWTFKTLKELGFGKTGIAEHDMREQVGKIVESIDQKISEGGGQANINMDLFFSSMIFQLTWRMITARLTKEDENDIEELCKKAEAFIRAGVFGAGLTTAFPTLRFIIPEATGYNTQMAFFNACNDVAKKLLLEAKETMEKGNNAGPPESLVEAFARNMEKDEDKETFFVENFQLIFQDLFIGSTETTSSYMEAVILYLILYPDVQEKVYNEIVQNSASSSQSFLEFRNKMVYTQAFLLEVHRNAPVLYNMVPRRAMANFMYKDYEIRKGTLIVPDLFSINFNPKVWGDPETFRPERFLDDSGKISGANRVLAFGLGKRVCPGELNANMLSLIFVTSLVQKYRIQVPSGHPKPSTELLPGLAAKPKQFDSWKEISDYISHWTIKHLKHCF